MRSDVRIGGVVRILIYFCVYIAVNDCAVLYSNTADNSYVCNCYVVR